MRAKKNRRPTFPLLPAVAPRFFAATNPRPHDTIGAMRENALSGFAALAAGVLLAGACWWLTVAMALDFSAPSAAASWRDAPYGVLFGMWAVMMAAMMAPSAAPFLRLFGRVAALQKSAPHAQTTAAAGGYFFVWLAVSALLAAVHLALGEMLNGEMALAHPHARAAVFAAAGIYQWTPFKFACLRGCRPPPLFLILHWRRGIGGAFRAGARNGLYCAGCCWALMLLLFAGGAMDLRWILALAAFALAEKTLPHPQITARLAGGVLLALAAAEILQ